MTMIRRTGTILMIAAALGLPALASAEEAPSALCEGSKAEHKQPTAENTKTNTSTTNRSDSKSQAKSEPKQAEKPAPDQSNKS